MEAIFPPVPASLGQARRMVGRIRDAPPNAIENAKLVLTELLANEIKHGRYAPGESLCCTVTRGGRAIRIEVRHTGPPFALPAAAPVPPLQLRETGWGLALITMLADRWGVGEMNGSRQVWAEIDLQQTAQPRSA